MTSIVLLSRPCRFICRFPTSSFLQHQRHAFRYEDRISSCVAGYASGTGRLRNGVARTSGSRDDRESGELFRRCFTTKNERRKSETTPSPWNIANLITSGRIAAAPLTGACIISGDYGFALGGLIYSGVSDWLDGFVARRFRLRTVLGSYLDPAADKLLISTTTICLASQNVIPIWLAALIIGRDIALVTGWLVLLRKQTADLSLSRLVSAARADAMEPLLISKLNTTLQIALGFSGVLFAGDWGVISEEVLDGIGMATALTTVASGASYGHKFWRIRRS